MGRYFYWWVRPGRFAEYKRPSWPPLEEEQDSTPTNNKRSSTTKDSVPASNKKARTAPTSSPSEEDRRLISKILLDARNPDVSLRETTLRLLTDMTCEFGSGPLFEEMLSLLLVRGSSAKKPALDTAAEFHHLVRALSTVLDASDANDVLPFLPKILVVAQPLLMEEGEGSPSLLQARCIVSTLSRKVGLNSMLAVIEPQSNDDSEYIRDAAAKALAVVSSELGVKAVLPTLRRFTWGKEPRLVRHTGIRAIEQIALLVGSAVRPHMKPLVESIHCLLFHRDLKVVADAAMSLAALAEAATPCHFDTFLPLLQCMTLGEAKIIRHEGEALAALLRLYGSILSLMCHIPDAIEASPFFINEAMREISAVLQEEEEERKRIGLQALNRCLSFPCDIVRPLLEEKLPYLLLHVWGRTWGRRDYGLLVSATVRFARVLGVRDVMRGMDYVLRTFGESYRRMARETIDKIIDFCGGASDADLLWEDILATMDSLFSGPF